MTHNSITKLLGVVAIALILLFVGVALPVSQAAPPAAPTPVANLISTGRDVTLVTLASLSSVSTTQAVTAKQLGNGTKADVQYVITQGSPANTATITLQYSNDNTNWVSGPALVSSNTSSTTDMTQVAIMGYYQRISMTLAGTSTVTVSVIAAVR